MSAPGVQAGSQGQVIAIIGAERSGKTALAERLATRITQATGLDCGVVAPPWPPSAHALQASAQTHQQRINAARADHAVVVADTTPLMSALHAQRLHDDRSLLPMALAAQREIALTLLTALDWPVQDDSTRREQVAFDSALRALLAAHGLAWSVIGGPGQAGLDRAFDAASPLLTRLVAPSARSAGLFSRLAAREAAPPARPWACEHCDVAACEHALWRQQRGASASTTPVPSS